VNKKVNLTLFLFFPLLFFFKTKIIITVSPTALNGQTRVEVKVGEGEPIESALRRFKREVNKSGHLMDLRHKRYFENSQDRKKRKIVQARIRKRLERMQARRLRQRAS
jgi:small subunit ribosomal protein S21